MPRIPEYRAGGVQSIPGPGSIPVPRATPDALGARKAARMQRAGTQISDVSTAYLDKITTENANIYTAEALADARLDFTKDFVKRKNIATGDISQQFDEYMQSKIPEIMKAAPNDLAESRVQIGLNQMRSTFNSKSVIFDDENRQNRQIEAFKDASVKDNLTVSEDMSQLPVLLGTLRARVDQQLSYLSPVERDKIYDKKRFELAETALQSLISDGGINNDRAIDILGDTKKWQSLITASQHQKLSKAAATRRRTDLYETQQLLLVNKRLRTTNSNRQSDTIMLAIPGAVQDAQLGNLSTLKNLKKTIDKDTTLTKRDKAFLGSYIRSELNLDLVPNDVQHQTFVNKWNATQAVDIDDVPGMRKSIQDDLKAGLFGKGNDALTKARLLLDRLDKPLQKIEKDFQNALKSALINPSLRVRDPKGQALFAQAMITIARKKDELQKANLPSHIYTMSKYKGRDNPHFLGMNTTGDTDLFKLRRSRQEINLDRVAEMLRDIKRNDPRANVGVLNTANPPTVDPLPPNSQQQNILGRIEAQIQGEPTPMSPTDPIDNPFSIEGIPTLTGDNQ